MSFLDQIFEEAKANVQTVVFPEAQDETMMAAAAEVCGKGIAKCILVGDSQSLRNLAVERSIDPDIFEYEDLTDKAHTENIAKKYIQLPDVLLSEKGITRRIERDPLLRAMAMAAIGDADVVFAGIIASTGDVIAAAQQIVLLEPGVETPSSFGIMEVPGWNGSAGNLIGVADPGVCVQPTTEQLAQIAIHCCDEFKNLVKIEPLCAILSHSTCGSAVNELSDKMQQVTSLAQSLRPDLKIDGEFQADAALNPKAAKKKVNRESKVAGLANVLICPNLDVANIMGKMVRLLAHSHNYGPMLQGFRRIVCDCSRSAGVEDIVGNVALGCVRAQARNKS